MSRRKRPKLTKEEAAAAREAKRAKIAGLLDSAATTMADPGTWRQFLAGPATFTKANGEPYSARNQLLIYQQMPDATDVAGLIHWRTRGRKVRAGEGQTGIMVFAPILRKTDPETEAKRQPGEMTSDDLKSPVRGIKVEYVYDISQTEQDGDAEFVPAAYAPAALLAEYKAIIAEIGGDKAAPVLAAIDAAERIPA